MVHAPNMHSVSIAQARTRRKQSNAPELHGTPQTH
jgi:hypothetical protein